VLPVKRYLHQRQKTKFLIDQSQSQKDVPITVRECCSDPVCR